jgi:histidyl-tRNA synthetase
MKFKRPRGTNDLFGAQMERWLEVESRLTSLIRNYGYSEIRTPIFESTDLFVRAVGEGTDIVSKEMYIFSDKKGRSLTLRPENTAPVMRAYLENGLHRTGGLARFYYIGPMFRYDRPQAGRYRQFHQVGVEAIGSQNPAVDAEVIEISLGIYSSLGFPPLDVRLNSVGCPACRPAFKEILKNELQGMKDSLCENCGERALVNPLRIFDCKECDEVKDRLPVITDHLCDECRDHFDRLRLILDGLGIEHTHDPLLVRGLDYYTKTAFEILHPELGAQNALCGGGRYDGLAEDCGGGFTPAVGFSAGVERLMETLPDDFAGDEVQVERSAYFVPLGDSAEMRALTAADELRGAGGRAVVDLSGRGLKKQLKAASEGGYSFAVIIGDDEMRNGEAAVKDLESGEQENVPFSSLVSYIRRRTEEERR